MAPHKKVKTAIIGCGAISKVYMENITTKFSIIDLVGCSDIISERSRARAEQFGIRQMTNEEILSDPEIEIVVNLTYPAAHFEVSKSVLEAGKHLCSEKMMSVTFDEAKKLVALAKEKNLIMCTAPDTFLGGGWQTVRKYVDDGLIGKPLAVSVTYSSSLQPDTPMYDMGPDYYFFPLHPGGGVPYDFGCYYLHNIINLLGSVKRVSGFGGNIFPDRMLTNPHHPKYKEPIKVETVTTLCGALEFENGCFGTLFFSSDSSLHDNFSIHGSESVMELWNPNFYSGKLVLKRVGSAPVLPGQAAPSLGPSTGTAIIRGVVNNYELPMLHGYLDNNRGLGLADMAYALRNNRRPRAHVDIGFHSHEILHGILESCKTGKVYEMTTRCERPKMIRPAALVATAQEYTLDD